MKTNTKIVLGVAAVVVVVAVALLSSNTKLFQGSFKAGQFEKRSAPAPAFVDTSDFAVIRPNPSFSVAADSPRGATTGGQQKIIFRFIASLPSTPVDPAEDNIDLNAVKLMILTSGVNILQNVAVYPSGYDGNSSYRINCPFEASGRYVCNLSSLPGNTNRIFENTSRAYVVRADVHYASAGALIVGINTSDDVIWSSGGVSYNGLQPHWFLNLDNAQVTTAAG